MPGCTSERVLPDAFSNFAQVGSERKLHIVRSAALIRNLSHTLVLVPADLHITVQVEATKVVFVLGLLAVSTVLLRRHAFGPKKIEASWFEGSEHVCVPGVWYIADGRVLVSRLLKGFS